jgi:hypothetical protein
MIKKNVYLFFPPGYSGNFLNWAIYKSDKDTGLKTVDDPINTTSSKKLGGAGTSHLHTRIPTHQGIHMHITWRLLHKPTDCMVYMLAPHHTLYVGKTIGQFAQFDKDGIFVNIHHGNDEAVDMFGCINMMTKWPTYLDVIKTFGTDLYGKKIDVSVLSDPYNCSGDRDFRNWIVEHYKTVLTHPSPLDHRVINDKLDFYLKWYKCRNKVQPHEINEEQYLAPNINLENRIFELSLMDICSENFILWLEQFMIKTQCSDDYDLTHVKNIHKRYLGAQTNLQWFTAFNEWVTTGKVDSFLTSHAGIEAMVIVKMQKNIGRLGIDWHNMDLHSINDYYQNVALPNIRYQNS